MKQIKFKQLATFSLCCSLLVNSLTGVTAVAETMTIESSPTVESKEQSEGEKESKTKETQVTETSEETKTEKNQIETSRKEDVDLADKIQESSVSNDSLEKYNNDGKQLRNILPRTFVWAATGTTNKTIVRLNDVVDYRLKFENITTDDTDSDIIGPIRIESKLAEGMTRPTSVAIKVGPQEQTVVLGEGSGNANSSGEYFVWTESTRTVTTFINRLHGRTSGQSGYIKTLYFQTTITAGTHNEKKFIDSTIRFTGFGAVNRKNEMTYADKYAGKLGLKGNFQFYDENGIATKEQMSVSMNPLLFKSTNWQVEGTPLRYPLTMINAGNGLYSFDTGLKTIGSSNGGSWVFFSNDISINFTTPTTNRIEKIVIAPPKPTLPDSRTGVMTSRAYTETTYTKSNYDLSMYNFTKATDKTWLLPNPSPNSGLNTNVMFKDNLNGVNGQFNTGNYGATVNYYIYYKKVSENFVDGSGQKIMPPSGFTQGKKTIIDSEAYTFKQSGTLPKSYKGTDGKTYVLKGWYKGKTKPSTLRTDAPSYKVTYDGNDDLNVVYEEAVEKTATIPAVTYKFGFVNEKGTLIAPSSFVMKTNLTTVINATPKQVGTATGVNNGNLKHLTIPSQQLTYTPTLNPAFSGATAFRLEVPKYYKMPTVKPGAHYTGSSTAYPIAKTSVRFINSAIADQRLEVNGEQYFLIGTPTAHSYRMLQSYWTIDSTKTAFNGVLSRAVTDNASGMGQPNYYTTDDTMYYFLENRRVTENFVDATGAKITPPTGFTQGKQTMIDSDNFTYTQEGSLPYIYKVNNKPYVLKGWYKGKDKPAKLNQISTDNRKISYPVSYDDQDDVTVVYDEIKLGDKTIQFGFVDEQGKYIPLTSKFNVSTDVGIVKDATYAKLQTVNSTIKGNYLSLTIPAYDPTGGLGQGKIFYGSLNSIVTIPKYYKKPTVTPSSNYQGTAYSTVTGVVDYHGNGPTNEYFPNRLDLFSVSGSQTNYQVRSVVWADEETNTSFNSLYKMSYNSPSETAMSLAEYYATGTVNYYLENRRVTENFVDASGAKITPPTGFTQGNQIPMTSDTFKYTAAKALPASYTAGGKTYVFQGWYKGKTKPNTLTTSTTPTYNTTFDDNDDMTAVYKEASISANLTMRGAVDIIDNGATMEYWEVFLKNTGEAPLTSIKIKPTAEWAAGISTPTELFLLGTGQNTKVLPITKEQWEAGFEIPLDSSLPVGGQLTINLIGTKVTGQPNQVLKAAVEVTGNFGNLKASDTVRIKDLDQETKEPTGEGFISVPTFDFGQVGVAGATKQHGLKKAADYYGNGTRNPYLRLKKTQPNWSLTAQLSQPKSAKDSLPTATRLIFGQVPVASVANYNQPTELVTSVGVTKALALTANNSSTSIIGTQEFGGADIYQLDFQFDKVKLEVPANQGTKGEQYNATVTWNLVTGP